MRGPGTGNWTDERVERLKKLNALSMSASEIAASLGGVTRNAVIGKLNRMGVGLTTGGARIIRSSGENRTLKTMRQKMRRQAAQVQPRLRRVIEQKISEVPDPDVLLLFGKNQVEHLTDEQKAKSVTFAELGPIHCRWPYGDPREVDFCFCGHDKLPDGPYCAPHAALASQPLRAKTNDTFKPLGEVVSAVVNKLRGAG